VVESFVTGTAFFITPVTLISFKGEDLKIPMDSDGKTGHYAKKFREWLTDIKYGNVQHEWGVIIEED
jgi:branched-chain amino acid aminotransferase